MGGHAFLDCCRITHDQVALRPKSRPLPLHARKVGLRAARGAGMQCLITPTSSTDDQPFCEEGAAAVVSALAGATYRVVGRSGRLRVKRGFCRGDAVWLLADGARG